VVYNIRKGKEREGGIVAEGKEWDKKKREEMELKRKKLRTRQHGRFYMEVNFRKTRGGRQWLCRGGTTGTWNWAARIERLGQGETENFAAQREVGALVGKWLAEAWGKKGGGKGGYPGERRI